jgi:hypothetical protein
MADEIQWDITTRWEGALLCNDGVHSGRYRDHEPDPQPPQQPFLLLMFEGDDTTRRVMSMFRTFFGPNVELASS